MISSKSKIGKNVEIGDYVVIEDGANDYRLTFMFKY